MIDLFWWAPARMPRIAIEEMRDRGSAWSFQMRKYGRILTNFGDQLSPLLVEEVFGTKTRWVRPQDAELLAIGSVIDLYVAVGGKGATVWGSGLRTAPGVVPFTDRLGNVAAVRGPLTATALGTSTTFGDPGVLAPLVFGSIARSGRRRKTALIPHFSEFSAGPARSLVHEAAKAGLRVVTPASSPLVVLRAIQESDFVLSSSLHGLICAHVMGVPAVHVGFNFVSSESNFKYLDFYNSVAEPFISLPLSDYLKNGQQLVHRTQAEERCRGLAQKCQRLGEGLLAAAKSL